MEIAFNQCNVIIYLMANVIFGEIYKCVDIMNHGELQVVW